MTFFFLDESRVTYEHFFWKFNGNFLEHFLLFLVMKKFVDEEARLSRFFLCVVIFWGTRARLFNTFDCFYANFI